MKKSISIFMVFLLIVLTGCEPPAYYFDSNDLIANTVKIELLSCKNNNPGMIEVDENNIPSFDYNDVETIDSLDHNQFESFIIELSTIRFHIYNHSVNKPIGRTLILHQKNGDMIVLSCTLINDVSYSFISKFDSNNNYITHIAFFADRPSFETLLNTYFLNC